MNLEQGIEKLKELLFKNEVKAELKFETATLNDGVTAIEWEGDLAVGTIVYVLDTNGSKLPMPLGQYQLEDGTTFEIVDEMGTADNVVKAEAPAEEVAPAKDAVVEQEATPNAPAPAPKRVIKSQVEEHVFSLEIEGVEPIVVDFSPMFSKVIAENKELKEKLEVAEKFSKEIAEVVTSIADEPSKVATEQTFKKVEKRLSQKELSALFKEALK